METPLAFSYAGTLPRLGSDLLHRGGVYVFVYDDGLPRVVYIGTAKRLAKRLRDHLELYRCGGRTFWVVKPGEDVYTLMQSSGEDAYIEGFRQHRCWVPGKTKRGSDWAALDESEAWDETWRARAETYISRLHVWICPMTKSDGSTDIASAKAFETDLQVALNHAFDLGYYDPSKKQSWLGRIERLDQEQKSWPVSAWPDVLAPPPRRTFAEPTQAVFASLAPTPAR